MSTHSEIIVTQSRTGSATHNILLQHDAGSEKLLILLPGRAYTCDFPVLYYLRKAALQLGYDVLSVEYGFQAARSDFNFAQLPDLMADVNDTLQPVLSRGYKQVCLVGKSLGTPIASQVIHSLKDIGVSLILLTPVGESTHGLGTIRTLAIIGTVDAAYSAEEVARFEGHTSVTWHVYEGLDHSLEYHGDWQKSAQILPEIIHVCTNFLGETS